LRTPTGSRPPPSGAPR